MQRGRIPFLSPVSTQTLSPARWRRAIVSGTPSWSWSSIAVTPRSWKTSWITFEFTIPAQYWKYQHDHNNETKRWYKSCFTPRHQTIHRIDSQTAETIKPKVYSGSYLYWSHFVNAQLHHKVWQKKIKIHVTKKKNQSEEEPTCSSLSIWSYSFSSSASRSQVAIVAERARVLLHCSHDASGTDRTATHKVLRQACANNWRKTSLDAILKAANDLVADCFPKLHAKNVLVDLYLKTLLTNLYWS